MNNKKKSCYICIIIIVSALTGAVGGFTKELPASARVIRDNKGLTRFIRIKSSAGPPRRGVIPQSPAVAENRARTFLAAHGNKFGIRNQEKELVVKRVRQVRGGRSFTRFQQVMNGIPVFAGELIVQTDAAGEVMSANGEVVSNPRVSTNPVISAEQARLAAQTSVTGWHDNIRNLAVSVPELIIYNPSLIGNDENRNYLAWKMELTGTGKTPFRELVIVNAMTGVILLHFNQVDAAKVRNIHDADSTLVLPGALARGEGDPPAGTETDTAYKFSGYTYNFYLNNHARDSFDDTGGTIVITVNYGTTDNAAWTGTQMWFGPGWASGLDVMAHEFTHAVTQYTSNLIYYKESGAINESMSDVWGELIELTYDTGPPADRWLIGEDVDTPFRDMEDPTVYSDPDKKTSPNWHTSSSDNYGVHTNSGVGNKACFLMVDGGSFNGYTVTGLGITKVVDLYYEAQANILTLGSDYWDLYNALQQAAVNLGYSAADTQEIKDAIEAVEMNYVDTTPLDTGSMVAYVFDGGDSSNPFSGDTATAFPYVTTACSSFYGENGYDTVIVYSPGTADSYPGNVTLAEGMTLISFKALYGNDTGGGPDTYPVLSAPTGDIITAARKSNIKGFFIDGIDSSPFYHSGVSLNGVTNANVSDIIAYNCEDGIYIDYSFYNNITNIQTYNNNYTGIDMVYSNSNNISNISIWDIDYNGFYTDESHNNTIDTVSIRNSSAEGMYLSFSNNNTIRNCESRDNNQDGFLIEYSNNNTLTGNRSYNNNNSAGFSLTGSKNNGLTGNISSGNDSSGFHLQSISTGNTLMHNRSFNNTGHGFRIQNSSNNYIAANDVDSNNLYGFYIEGTSTNDTFQKNNFNPSPYGPDSGVWSNITDTIFGFTRNWWGATDSQSIRNKISGAGADSVQFVPFRLGAVDTSAGADTIAPASPSLVTITDTSSSERSCTVVWSDATTNEEIGGALADLAGYRVYRSTSANPDSWGAPIVTNASNDTDYYDSNLLNDVNYYYRVTSYDTKSPLKNESFYSDSIANCIIARVTSSFIVSSSDTSVTSGQWFTLSITALDQYNNTFNTYSGTVSFSVNAGTITTSGGDTASNNFVSGLTAESVQVSATAAVVITVTDVTGSTGSITINGVNIVGGQNNIDTVEIAVGGIAPRKSYGCTVTLSPASDSTNIVSSDISDTDGVFQLSGVSDGNYKLVVERAGALRRVVNVTVAGGIINGGAGITITPIDLGDCNNSGDVGVGDWATIVSKWLTNDISADANNSGDVGVGDWATVVSNWGKTADPL